MPPSVDAITPVGEQDRDTLLQNTDVPPRGSPSSQPSGNKDAAVINIEEASKHAADDEPVEEIDSTALVHDETYFGELKEVLKIALPAAASTLLQNLMGTVDLIMVVSSVPIFLM